MSWRKVDSVNIEIVNPWHKISLMVPQDCCPSRIGDGCGASLEEPDQRVCSDPTLAPARQFRIGTAGQRRLQREQGRLLTPEPPVYRSEEVQRTFLRLGGPWA